MQESRQPLHEQQDGDGQVGPEEPQDEDDDAADVRHVHLQRQAEHHGPQHFGQLCRGKKEGQLLTLLIQHSGWRELLSKKAFGA